MKPLCIYHGNCADGFTSAWVVRNYFKSQHQEADYHAGVYQTPPPDVTDREVIMVDFSYKSDVLVEMAKQAKSILILDHHKTAEADLRYIELKAPNVRTVFDMERSGAGLAWDYYYSGIPRPPLINHVEDRDLWRFWLRKTREIQANIFSYPYEFAIWDMLHEATIRDIEGFADGGEAIERKHFKDIRELIKVVTRRMLIGGYNVPVANLPYTLTSDAGNILAENEPFAACYWDTPDGRVFSLRSKEDGIDVSKIASQYGGGGHKNASGFKVKFYDLEQFELNERKEDFR